MANVRNPQIVSTTAVLVDNGSVNVEKVLSVSKQGTDSLIFTYDYNKTERSVIWKYANTTDRNTEYALLTVASDDFSTGTDGLFVSPSLSTIKRLAGTADSNPECINLNAVVKVSKTNSTKNFIGDGGAPVYGIAFTFDAVDSLKEATWFFASSANRDTVYGELVSIAANANYFIENEVPTVNAGVAATGFTAEEKGDSVNHVTVLTVDTTFGAIAGGANLALGKLAYTFPAGAINIKASKIDVALTAEDGNIDADTPDVGLGTTLASGANALLSGAGATTENILTGQTATNCTGTATVKTLATSKVIETAEAHTVYLNIADGWAASGEAALPVTGTVTIEWTFIG